jgi:hypothetical protein
MAPVFNLVVDPASVALLTAEKLAFDVGTISRQERLAVWSMNCNGEEETRIQGTSQASTKVEVL